MVCQARPRIGGRTLPVRIDEVTPFTLFGEVRTGEQVGVEDACGCDDEGCEVPGGEARRFGLPLVCGRDCLTEKARKRP